MLNDQFVVKQNPPPSRCAVHIDNAFFTELLGIFVDTHYRFCI